MAKYFTAICPNKKINTCNYIFNSGKLIGYSKNLITLKCEGCGEAWTREAPKIFVKSLRYPHFNDSIGEMVDSVEHQDHLAKENGLSRVD